MNRMTTGEKIFNVTNSIFMVMLVFLTVYPIWYVLIASLSSGAAVSSGKVIFWIKDFTWEAYRQIFRTKNLLNSYGNTVFYSVVGAPASMVFTTTAAFTLSFRDLPFKKSLTMIFMFVMWFGPGMMPTYLNIRNLHLSDTILGII